MPGKVEIRNIRKSYGSFVALNDVSLDIAPGEFLTLLGPSGSGKTTLLNVLAGFVRPDSGSITIDGTEFLTLPPHKRNLGMVFQNYALFPHMSVGRNVGYPLRLRGVPATEIERRVRDALDLVQMAHLADRSVDALSGGQRQRVALARAIVFEPSILLMDEPLSALDKKLREHMQLELKRLHNRLGTTTVYVTHDQREALTLSDRIAVVNGGRIAQLGTPDEIYDRPRNKFVADFIGETRFLPVEHGASGLSLYGRPLKARDEWKSFDGDTPWLVVRPERLRWYGEEADAANRIDAEATGIIYQGDSYLVTVRMPDGVEIDLRRGPDIAGKELLQRGQPVHLWLDREHTILVSDKP
ncbi:ABC transporter ATP-binding protein [Mesorhizobium sp. 8]|uniref:ABC transporter ATP-binding protein n=1 Tax=Mesorhizobium sp. 8 TaxID=2584466 RepID=UPI0011215F40|nr:ABC transporter ATP-binding protein [Mesorhizobium sp. 8]QDC00714.1 ABC transporter ATP-binding protein [Mesorhizobium sp. 8]